MKLGSWAIFSIFFFLGLCALTYSYFYVYAPYEVATKYMNDYKDQLDTEAGKQLKAHQKVEHAIKTLNDAAVQWNQYADTKTPSDSLATGGIQFDENQYQLVVDSPKFRNNAQRLFNAQIHRGGVKVIASSEIPKPTDSENDILASYYNFPAFPFPVVIWELGTVTVRGTYAQIMANVRSWSDMPHYLAVTDGLRLDGTSPNLTASYNVTLVGFIRASKVYPGIPSGAPATGGAGGPGMPAGGGGGPTTPLKGGGA